MDSRTTFSGELMSFFMFWGVKELPGNKLSGFYRMKEKKQKDERNLIQGPGTAADLNSINQSAGTCVMFRPLAKVKGQDLRPAAAFAG